MTKHKYLFHNYELNKSVIVDTMTQLIDKSGLSYRTIQRIFGKRFIYYAVDGKYKIEKIPYEPDRRKNNGRKDI